MMTETASCNCPRPLFHRPGQSSIYRVSQSTIANSVDPVEEASVQAQRPTVSESLRHPDEQVEGVRKVTMNRRLQVDSGF